jgi:hypothetical protein
MNRAADSRPVFTPRQGRYLAFIHAYTLVNGRPPAQADIQRFFRLTPPSVHQMLLTLERSSLISRRAGVPRSITVLIDRYALPQLEPGHIQQVKFSVQGYSWWLVVYKQEWPDRHPSASSMPPSAVIFLSP